VISKVSSEASDCLSTHPHKAGGALRGDAFRKMASYRDGLLLFDLGVEKGGVLAL
jgi:hypothetical protein